MTVKRTRTDRRAPLFAHYPVQCFPQPAYIEIDPSDGTVELDWKAELGDGMPAAEWHGLICRIPCANNLSRAQCRALLKRIEPLVDVVCDGFDTAWDGRNWVGRYTPQAERALEDIHEIAYTTEGDVDV